MTVSNSAGLGDGAVFGFFFEPMPGRSLVAIVAVRREPLPNCGIDRSGKPGLTDPCSKGDPRVE